MEEIASAAEVHVALLGGFSVTVNGQPAVLDHIASLAWTQR